MASAPPGFSSFGAPRLPTVQVDVALEPGAPPTPVLVPANSEEEAFRLLHQIGNGSTAGVAYGSALAPIRNTYKRQLEQVEQLIRERRAALGPKATEYELRGLAQWAARQRTATARLWRLPLPVTGIGLEIRDQRVYGLGGRTFDNLLARSAKKGLTGTAAYENILGSATRSNARVNESIAKGARFMKRGGAVLGVAGLAVSAHDIWQAPDGQRLQVAQRHGLGFAGGLVGAEVSAGLLAIGAGLLVATPPGWLVLGVGLVGGIAGGIIADRVFYPDDYRPVADTMEAGYAIDPNALHQRFGGAGAGNGTTLPVIGTVTLQIRAGETPAELSRRANLQAAASVGLPSGLQEQFADRHGRNGLNWMSGDPSPGNDRSMRPGDIAATAGTKVIFRLSPEQRAELTAMGAQR